MQKRVVWCGVPANNWPNETRPFVQIDHPLIGDRNNTKRTCRRPRHFSLTQCTHRSQQLVKGTNHPFLRLYISPHSHLLTQLLIFSIMSTNPAEAYAEKLRLEREANPITIDSLDDNVIASKSQVHHLAFKVLIRAEIPAGTEIIQVVPSGASAWCKTFRIDAKLENGDLKSYFMKVSTRVPCSNRMELTETLSMKLASLVDV